MTQSSEASPTQLSHGAEIEFRGLALLVNHSRTDLHPCLWFLYFAGLTEKHSLQGPEWPFCFCPVLSVMAALKLSSELWQLRPQDWVAQWVSQAWEKRGRCERSRELGAGAGPGLWGLEVGDHHCLSVLSLRGDHDG